MSRVDESAVGPVPEVATRPVDPAEPDQRWRDHPWFARIVRWSILLVPIAVSFLFALALSRAIPMADETWLAIVRWLLIAVASTLVLLVMQQLARRFLPLAVLYSLTLVFPDSAPSRFGLALRTGTTKQLEHKIEQVGEDGLGDTPRDAAMTLLELVAALSRHDRLTRGHSERVRAYSRMIGEEMGLDGAELDRLHWAGLVHDVGKAYVPAEILSKPGSLTDEEFAVVKTHTEHGQRLVEPLVDWLGPSAAAVWEHHERWEGGGYPSGVASSETALESRIVCVADAFDVMTSARSYKRPISATRARAELERCAGSQFDPDVVRAMLSVSLGKLWAAMGPLSLLAQIRLFPRRLTQGTSTASAAIAAIIAALVATLAAGLPWAGSAGSDEPPAAAVDGGEGDGFVTPSDSTTTTTSPTGSTTTSTTTTSSTTTSSTTLAPVTTAPVPATTAPAAAVTTVAPATTIPATTPATTTPATTTPATTTPATTTPPVVVGVSTTSTTTTTTVPVSPTRLTLASSASGEVGSQAVLPLEVRAPINVGALPNYDIDRDDDPGLTIRRAADGLAGADPTAVQVWRAPDTVRSLDGPVRMQLWVKPTTTAVAGFSVVTAALYDCAPGGADCVTLADDVGVLVSSDSFTGVAFDLTPGSDPYAVAGGRVIEVRIAVLASSVADVVVAYDTTSYPAVLTFG